MEKSFQEWSPDILIWSTIPGTRVLRCRWLWDVPAPPDNFAADHANHWNKTKAMALEVGNWGPEDKICTLPRISRIHVPKCARFNIRALENYGTSDNIEFLKLCVTIVQANSYLIFQNKKVYSLQTRKVQFSSEPEVNSRILAYRSPSTASK